MRHPPPILSIEPLHAHLLLSRYLIGLRVYINCPRGRIQEEEESKFSLSPQADLMDTPCIGQGVYRGI